jgi:uncharacterized protein YggE
MRTLLASLLLLACSTAFAGTPLPDAPHVVASGQGKVSVKPDAARVQFDFEQRAAQPLPAKQGVDAAVNRLLDSLDAYGVADDDVTASSLDASEDVDYDDEGKRISNGFVASRSVTVLLKDVDRLNAFLDNGLESGAHGIGSVAFESSREDALREQARKEAVADARARAVEMANAFGVRLGAVYSIGSINSRYEDQYGATTLDRVEVTGSRIQRGRYVQPEVEYTETVSAVFELLR